MSKKMLPYGRQTIDQADIDAVVDVLKSDWLTTGPKVAEFEEALAKKVGAKYAVAVSSGTAALHCAMAAIGIGPGDEVIVPTITFLATANCVVYQGGVPVFADVLPDTLLIDPLDVEKKITPKTRAIIAVDYAGQPCDYTMLQEIAKKHNLVLIADACHSLGASLDGRPVGSLADITVFSFHPVKVVAAGEGGMLVTNNEVISEFTRSFRNHGMTIDQSRRDELAQWRYDMNYPGFNYRMSDMHAALGLSQLSKLEYFIARRQELASLYDCEFKNFEHISPLCRLESNRHAYHLYIVKIDNDHISRDEVFSMLRARGLGVNVHYYPVHLQSFYHTNYKSECSVSESVSLDILSLPIFPSMKNSDVDRVISELTDVLS